GLKLGGKVFGCASGAGQRDDLISVLRRVRRSGLGHFNLLVRWQTNSYPESERLAAVLGRRCPQGRERTFGLDTWAVVRLKLLFRVSFARKRSFAHIYRMWDFLTCRNRFARHWSG